MPVYLYLQDPLVCIELLFNHPFFHDKLDFTPQHVYEIAEGVVEHTYSEWLTGNAAWRMQVCLRSYVTMALCDVIWFLVRITSWRNTP